MTFGGGGGGGCDWRGGSATIQFQGIFGKSMLAVLCNDLS